MVASSTLLEIDLSVTDAIALLNQTLEYAYPSMVIVGELSGFRVSKNRWVYFDLKDEFGVLRFFGTVYNLPGPLEDGMMLRVIGTPRIHPLYGFSLTVQQIVPVGEGALKKAFELLLAKLTAEGLFDPSRKRAIPYPPDRIGLITSKKSAAEADFLKIAKARWPLLEIEAKDVHVQGSQAISEIIEAIETFNSAAVPPEVLVITRGGGSAEDLAAFNDERLVRAIAASRIPTIVAIGHEVDSSLAEMAADLRASTPSNAAELLVPDIKNVKLELQALKKSLTSELSRQILQMTDYLKNLRKELRALIIRKIEAEREALKQKRLIAGLYDPKNILSRGYALVRSGGKTLKSVKGAQIGQNINIQLKDGVLDAEVRDIKEV